MAKVLQTTLQISEANVEQYCIADGLSLNTGGYAIRLYMNGHTQGSAILNDAAKEVLYPSATAHPFKIDSFIRANKSGGSMTISLQFDGTNVQSETGDWGTGLKNKTKEGISDPVVINSNRSTEIKWHIKGSSTVSRFSIASTKLTFYFNQYEMRPLVGNNANGIQKVTVSNASPCQGDTVTFTPKLVNGATWDGWYSDAACTNLVSTDQNYSVSPSSDITLYAKAIIDANLYNVSAVAGTEITSVNVSDSIVPEGSTATFTAQVNTGCSFEAWYSDDTYTTIVSTENPYTATITADTTLYAKAHRNSFNMSVGSAEHGTASVSATTVPYGSDATFTFTPEDETWELYGWYSDAELTQLVSEANPYTFTATEDTALYPKVGRIRYTITLTFKEFSSLGVGKMAIVDFNSLTEEEIGFLKSGNYDSIDANKVYDTSSVTPDNTVAYRSYTISIRCPRGLYVAMYLQNYTHLKTKYYRYIDGYTWWPYYWYQPNQDASFVGLSETNTSIGACNCIAIAKDNISSVDATTPVVATKEAIFTAKVNTGCSFVGWYSDEACTQLVSNNNPAYVVTPQGEFENGETYRYESSLTLYAKATKVIYTIGVGTAEHGSASVSATTAYYGDTVTFNCTVDEGYEFKGWYSDEGLTQLVSETVNYEHTVTGSVTLWPKIEIITYKVTLVADHQTIFGALEIELNIIAVDFEALTRKEKENLKTGDYDLISQEKIYDRATDSGNQRNREISVSVNVPKGKYAAMYMPEGRASNVISGETVCIFYITNHDKGDNYKQITTWPYYWVKPTQDVVYGEEKASFRCKCVAVAKEGISYVDATTPVWDSNDAKVADDTKVYNAIFLAEVDAGYKFSGWYSDEACTTIVSSENPAYIKTPNEADGYSEALYTLYAKATKTETQSTGISLKLDNTWTEAKAVYMKVNGVWEQQSNPASLFSGSPSGTESNYLYLGE